MREGEREIQKSEERAEQKEREEDTKKAKRERIERWGESDREERGI